MLSIKRTKTTTKIRRKIAQTTGIPTTKQGRQAKPGRKLGMR